jgi:hypothetical protein
MTQGDVIFILEEGGHPLTRTRDISVLCPIQCRVNDCTLREFRVVGFVYDADTETINWFSDFEGLRNSSAGPHVGKGKGNWGWVPESKI